MNSRVIGDVVKLLSEFNHYTFYEDTHTYYYDDKIVEKSVTQFIKKFYPEFDSESISKKYAAKHGMTQEEVLAEWKRKGDIAALSGTAIHNWLENAKRGKVLKIDFSEADAVGLGEEVRERFEILLPKAKAFHADTLGKLYPIQLEFTVGHMDKLAGNIDVLCWNELAQEIQIWDYKNTKSIDTRNNFNKYAYGPFSHMLDCNLLHYSMQLSTYKALLAKHGIAVGKMYLVHFDYNTPGDNFDIYECFDLSSQMTREIELL